MNSAPAGPRESRTEGKDIESLEDLRAELRKAVRETLAGRPRPASPPLPQAVRPGMPRPADPHPFRSHPVPAREIHRTPLQPRAAASSPVRPLQELKPSGPPPFARFLIALDLLAILVLLNRIFD